ncbi:NAD-dependent epimerase/dehydratase family protein [Halocalculus aciditolerans]|uniref:NAD-dependent dehydratase n=1 Tax=Halocalculus aciditolerans TaxID=1383812 RepID=A0A830FBX2_9EURY|nr:NAD-dependent epimerase/dehydratase family protein [Halocalculus aciditolerans]GGL59563.1 NAD-dependent dehydratase [Halocalculus aciditolerans]
MTVLLTGADGYLGWPTTLRLADRIDDRIVAVDNGARREWVAESGSVSAVPIDEPEARFETVDGVSYVEGDLADREFVTQLVDVYEPDTVLHAAAQPSAVYAGINGERALYTQRNNVSSTLNLLHALHEAGLDDTHFIETTTTGVYGAPEFPIPEGGAEMSNEGESDEVPFPAMGGSWYHQTKAFDAGNMRLANGEWGMPISDVRTAIVFGTETEETEEYGMPTRFDFDYYFGTVVNRFCAQAVAGYPITVYGKGEQRKPMVTLEDAVESLVALVERGPEQEEGVTVYNQVNRPVAIVELAETIAEVGEEFDLDADVEHFENPREEDEEHQMEMDNANFRGLVDDEMSMEEGIRQVLGTLVDHRERIEAHEDRFLPGVLTD